MKYIIFCVNARQINICLKKKFLQRVLPEKKNPAQAMGKKIMQPVNSL